MKQSQLFILAGVVAVFLGTYMISSGAPASLITGFTFIDRVSVQTTDIVVHDNYASLGWTTNKDSVSTLTINGERYAFAAAQFFTKDITNLQTGERYFYVIRACDDLGCDEIAASLTTTSDPVKNIASPITGAATGIDILGVLQNSVGYVFLGLIVVAVLVIGGRVAGQQIQRKDEMAEMTKSAKKMIDEQKYREAYDVYLKARTAFAQLEEEAKLKHYNDLYNIYHSLNRQSKMQEAQRLAEKFSDGTISNNELDRLNQLMHG